MAFSACDTMMKRTRVRRTVFAAFAALVLSSGTPVGKAANETTLEPTTFRPTDSPTSNPTTNLPTASPTTKMPTDTPTTLKPTPDPTTRSPTPFPSTPIAVKPTDRGFMVKFHVEKIHSKLLSQVEDAFQRNFIIEPQKTGTNLLVQVRIDGFERLVKPGYKRNDPTPTFD